MTQMKQQKQTNELKKQMRRDRRKRLLDMVSKDLDVRDRWMGTRLLTRGYQPIPYNMKKENGQRIPSGNRAQKAAKFVASDN